MANEWMNHPDLKNLDPIKLQLLPPMQGIKPERILLRL